MKLQNGKIGTGSSAAKGAWSRYRLSTLFHRFAADVCRMHFVSAYLALVFFASVPARAQIQMPGASTQASSTTSSDVRFKRKVAFDWDPIEEAKGYEVEIKLKKGSVVVLEKTTTPKWAGYLDVGQYEMRLRALDHRGVPGEWSPESDLDIVIQKSAQKLPLDHARIQSEQQDEQTVDFAWEPSEGARFYELSIVSEDNRIQKTLKVPEAKITLRLPVARSYRWSVIADAGNGYRSPSSGERDFVIFGGELRSPEIATPDNEFVRKLQWKASSRADQYLVRIWRFEAGTKSWKRMKAPESLTETSLPFQASWPGGLYRLNVKAFGEKRIPSKTANLAFRVRDGDRSPEAQFYFEIRQSIDRLIGWYGLASYLITMVHYSSSNFDQVQATSTSFDALGGTGRLGVGYLSGRGPWGGNLIVDLSGFTSEDNRTMTFASAELSAVRRTPVLVRGELRITLGLHYREQPIAKINLMNSQVASYENASVGGAQVGAEFWYSLSPKLGFQVNAQMYEGLFALKTPNGQGIEPTFQWQAGLLGSLRLTDRATGLMGYEHREVRTRYKATGPGANSNRTNDSALTGEYFNVFMEYGF